MNAASYCEGGNIIKNYPECHEKDLNLFFHNMQGQHTPQLRVRQNMVVQLLSVPVLFSVMARGTITISTRLQQIIKGHFDVTDLLHWRCLCVSVHITIMQLYIYHTTCDTQCTYCGKKDVMAEFWECNICHDISCLECYCGEVSGAIKHPKHDLPGHTFCPVRAKFP